MRPARAWPPIATGLLTVLVTRTGLVATSRTSPPRKLHQPVRPPTAERPTISAVSTPPHTRRCSSQSPPASEGSARLGRYGRDHGVLSQGSGDNAHVYDQFASVYQFLTDRFRVIGITRRGFGHSSQPASGYDLDTRARDDIAVLDTLKIGQAVSSDTRLPERTLLKLSACLPIASGSSSTWMRSTSDRITWESTPSAAVCSESYCRRSGIGAASCRGLGTQGVGTESRSPRFATSMRIDSSGKVVGPVTPPRDYRRNSWLACSRPSTTVSARRRSGSSTESHLDSGRPTTGRWRLRSSRSSIAASRCSRRPGSTERSGTTTCQVRDSRVVELQDTNHYVYIVVGVKRWSCEKCASSCSVCKTLVWPPPRI